MFDFARSFEKSNHLLGRPPQQPLPIVNEELKRVRMAARYLYRSADLEPGSLAKQRIRDVIVFFFETVQTIVTSDNPHPLVKVNKCMGMTAIPGLSLVLVALSEDPHDEPVRRAFHHLLGQVNTKQNRYVFELVCSPTTAEYLMIRSLRMRSDHTVPSEIVQARTRCIEVALMVALNKIGRLKTLNPFEVHIQAMSPFLWKDGTCCVGFEGATRNVKYLSEPPIVMRDGSWIDLWSPCKQHCAIFAREILSVAFCGSCASSFTEPRSDHYDLF